MPNMNLKGVPPARPPIPGARPGAPAGAPQQEKKKLLGLPMPIALGVGGLLGVGLVVGILFLTGVLGEDEKPKFERPLPPVDITTNDTVSLAAVTPQKSITKVEEPKAKLNNGKVDKKNSVNPNRKNYAMPSSGGAFSIQVESWGSQTKANMRAQVYLKAGFQTFVDRGGKKNNYRVLVGRFATKNEARRSAEKIAQMLESGYTIIKLN
ncbi:MAG: SPOR domain-containing protein [Bacteroidota bacterium]